MNFNKIALLAASALALTTAASANATTYLVSGQGGFKTGTAVTSHSNSGGSYQWSFKYNDLTNTFSAWAFEMASAGGTLSPVAGNPLSIVFGADTLVSNLQITFGDVFLNYVGHDWVTTGFPGAASLPDTFVFASKVDGTGAAGASNAAITLTAVSVPEPATWALMLGGFGLAGLSLRSRSSKYKVGYAA